MLKTLATLRLIVMSLGPVLCDRSPGSCSLYIRKRVESEDIKSVNLLETAFGSVKEFYQRSVIVQLCAPGT